MTTTDQRDSSRTTATSPAARSSERKEHRGARAAQAAGQATSKATTQATRKRRKPSSADVYEQLHTLVLQALEDLKARDVQEVDVREKSQVTDTLIVASGTSSRHVRSIAEEVVKLAKQADLPPIGMEGEEEGEWVLVDLGDIVVHVMQPKIREFYGLERLWTVGDDAAADAG